MFESADKLFARFSQQRLMVVGDIMLDWFIWGAVSRISPEAPVPVVEVQEEDRYPGGAANVARNLTPFGTQVELAGLYGTDANGALLKETLEKNKIGSHLCLEVDDFQTITKTRVVARHQQVVRIDREQRYQLTKKVEAELIKRISAQLSEIDGLIIEDYGKGLITPELVKSIMTVAKENNVVVTVDPKPGNPIPWNGATTVKPNRSEGFACAAIEDIHRDESVPPMQDKPLLEVGKTLRDKWQCEQILLTLGEQGMLLFSDDQSLLVPAQAKEVFDVSGAGDTAIAIYTLALCSGLTPIEATNLSNLASSIVVGKLGTTPIEKQELQQAWTKFTQI